MRIFTITTNDAGQRLDKFLTKLMPSMPKGMLYKLIRKKDIRLNQARCKGTEILREGDTVRIFAKEEFFANDSNLHFMRASGKPDLLYEDDSILIAYKPSGMYAHNGEDGAVSLLDEIQKYLYEKGTYLPEQEHTFAPALCNRIDRNTEGLVIAAKTAAALRDMNEAIRERKVHKHYLAITAAPLPGQHETCTAWLKKEERQVQVADTPADPSWKRIVTEYRVLAQSGRMQLVQVTLHTGRTHQIRAHLASLGAPILGDPKYGQLASEEENQCLCAWSLSFTGLAGTDVAALDGRTVTVPAPEFVRRYFPDAAI